MNNNTIILLVLFGILLRTMAVAETSLLINTLEEPPGSFTDQNGKLTGLSVDMVREIQTRVGNADPIRVYPWARTYQNALRRPNVVAFTATRTPEREEKFYWITQIARSEYGFFARKGNNISITSLDDAKKLKRIGVMRTSVWEQFLVNNGFTNVDLAVSHAQNLEKLMAGRFQVIYFYSAGFFQDYKTLKLDANEFTQLYTTQRVESYILMSKNGTPKATVNKWKKAASEIKRDGTFEKIAGKWILYMKEKKGFQAHYENGAVNYWKKED
ncbi:MAG: ABC transporter substrate-binding protein [Desulfobacterium sp.]|nr:ABC transporter substrate-binding protein [Desulfobacterium sp.]